MVVSQRLVVGDEALALAWNVMAADTLESIHYGDKLAPEGESCDGTAATSTAPATMESGGASAVLTACSDGELSIRLVGSGSGSVLEGPSMTIEEKSDSEFS